MTVVAVLPRQTAVDRSVYGDAMLVTDTNVAPLATKTLVFTVAESLRHQCLGLWREVEVFVITELCVRHV